MKELTVEELCKAYHNACDKGTSAAYIDSYSDMLRERDEADRDKKAVVREIERRISGVPA